ncbi:embryo sac development arrest eda7 [Cystoisospora suis]|uniref:Embryo sac development arrest eda7 n=1 Tax=Cystoisospora suis TaxID=483139 RepID=A0A2C6L1V5_9APIC|nr:embryo sac development arrest eda7 [Cystoisospora suis]
MVKVTSSTGDAKVYHLSSGRSRAADLLPRRKRRRQRERKGPGDEPEASEVELLQDFEFNISSQCVKVSPDGEFVTATGIYPPEVRVYEVQSMGLKFRRGLDHEVVDFTFLSEDYRKLLFLQEQRHVDIHTQGGTHHKMRIPREGRGLCFLPSLASICIAASGSEVYMVDLEDGCFLTPWTTGSPANNCCFTSSVLPILAVGGENGVVECFDHRTARSVSALDVSADNPSTTEEGQVTCGAFSPGGLQMCVGTSAGTCLLYDLRSRRPLCCHSHSNMEPIKQLQWKRIATGGSGKAGDSHSESMLLHGGQAAQQSPSTSAALFPAAGGSSQGQGSLVVASCDPVSIHVWRESTGEKNSDLSWLVSDAEIHSVDREWSPRKEGRAEVLATIQAPLVSADDDDRGGASQKHTGGVRDQRVVRFNGFAFYGDSGLCFTPCEQKRVGVYFVPSLGIAPRWCAFLDTMTEELQASSGLVSSDSTGDTAAGAQYGDYRFVTRQQLEQMGVQDLIGTGYVKRYMHGYFMDSKLYRKLQETLTPFAFEEYRREKIRQKASESEKMRIEIRHKQPKANSALARRLEETALAGASAGTKKGRKQQEAARQLLKDERFERLFSNPDFEIEGDNGD